jgi:hypothetical protein
VLAVISAVVGTLPVDTWLLPLVSGLVAGVLITLIGFGTKRSGCGNEELMAPGITNLPMSQFKK